MYLTTCWLIDAPVMSMGSSFEIGGTHRMAQRVVIVALLYSSLCLEELVNDNVQMNCPVAKSIYMGN